MNIKHKIEYFLKLHPEDNVFYGQIGHGKYDHDHNNRPELLNNQCRPAWRCDKKSPCTEPAAETAASLAAASIFFMKIGTEKALAMKCFIKAKSLMEFADNYRQKYHETVTDAYNYYRSFSGYFDELVHGWSWIARAEEILGTAKNKRLAINKAMGIYIKYLDNSYPMEYSWDNKLPSALINLAKLTDEPKIWKKLDWFVSKAFTNRQETTNFGLPYVSDWGSNRYAANLAFIGILAVKLHEEQQEKWHQEDLNSQKIIEQCKFVANYILGDNPMKTSYIVGYRKPGSSASEYKTVQNPHHKAAACPTWPKECKWETFEDDNGPNPHIIYGALVGGPKKDDTYNDQRSDYRSNEVTIDYNAGWMGLIAGLKMEGKGLISSSMGARALNGTTSEILSGSAKRRRRQIEDEEMIIMPGIDWHEMRK